MPHSHNFRKILNRLRNNDPELTGINLTSDKIGDRMFIKLCEALKSNTSLKTLYL